MTCCGKAHRERAGGYNVAIFSCKRYWLTSVCGPTSPLTHNSDCVHAGILMTQF